MKNDLLSMVILLLLSILGYVRCVALSTTEDHSHDLSLIMNRPIDGTEFNANTDSVSRASSPSFADGVVNTNVFTMFVYNGSQIYVYNAVNNEAAAATPHKWVFYYVPILAPIIEYGSPWVWASRNEVRVRLLLGDSRVEEMARKAIEKKFDLKTVEYSKYWDISPLMIDSLTAYIVRGSSSPIPGIEPYHTVHPNALVMTLRFRCSTQEKAAEIATMLDEGEYEIEIAFHFAGFRQASTNFVSISGDQIKGVSSKTAADGGDTNAEYIHRSQASNFVSLYNTNVNKIVYIENPNYNPESSYGGMQDTFFSLMKQAMDELTQTKLSADAYGQIWNSSDLNPNVITSEMNQIFTYNKTATEMHHDGTNYFNVNWQKLKKSAKSTNVGLWGSFGKNLLGIFSLGVAGGLSVGHDSNSENMETHQETTYEAISDKYIHDSFEKHDARVEWTGEKFQAKSFGVFKITEVTDRLQTAMISKQIIADKNQSAIIRVISTMNTPKYATLNKTEISQFLTGEVKLFAGTNPPPLPWLLCDGAAVSRVQYQRLFGIIGERYGSGDGVHTFNLPDFRGRVPLGVDGNEMRVAMAKQTGVSGGKSVYQLSSSQLPGHKHSQGTLYMSSDGGHTHTISDPGHDHGGQTGSARMGSGSWGMKTGGGYATDQATHAHTISRDYTRISIQSAGSHSHRIYGDTGPVGNAEPFTVMPPYQTIYYVIYAD